MSIQGNDAMGKRPTPKPNPVKRLIDKLKGVLKTIGTKGAIGKIGTLGKPGAIGE